MRERGNRLANLFLRYASFFAELRRVPVLGDFLSWTGRMLLPRDTLVWIQIQHGPAEGLWIRVNPRTGQNVQQGIGEPQVQQALVNYLRPGMTFYDLGANIGYFSLIAARLVGPTGRVVSFEADPEIAARLRENLARNNFSHARVEQKAVWSGVTTVSFARVDPHTSPDRGLGHVCADSSGDTITVKAISLDSYVTPQNSPDFLKCDVEGAEAEVFRGAERLLAERRTILLVEMHNTNNHRTLAQKFVNLGCTVRNLDENHVLALPK
ncbi:MAG TPA: FkbM family methyltransferase [Candidatus Acidoferrum sp.]|nr:FkbM family methyltransferase [Candidatus Acidoferrum sp.]